MTFYDLEFVGTYRHKQARHDFPNGYGVSVVQGPTTYGGNEGLYELAVFHDGKLCYQSGITDDVLGWLNPSQITKLLDRIEKLEPKTNCVHRNTNWD